MSRSGFWSLMIVIVFCFSCQQEPMEFPSYLDYTVEIGSTDRSFYTSVLNDSSMHYFDSLQYIETNFSVVLGAFTKNQVGIDLDGDSNPEFYFISTVITEEDPSIQAGSSPEPGPFFYTYSLSLEKGPKIGSSMIAVNGPNIGLFEDGQHVNLRDLELSSFTEVIISSGRSGISPFITQELYGSWSYATRKSLLVVSEINGQFIASTINLSVRHFNSVIVHEVISYRL